MTIEQRVKKISVDMFKKEFEDISAAEAYTVMYRIVEENEKQISKLKDELEDVSDNELAFCQDAAKKEKQMNELKEQLKARHIIANADELKQIAELKKKIYYIPSMKDDSGREGCTYGDTEHDSMSVVYGYNNAIDDIYSYLNKH